MKRYNLIEILKRLGYSERGAKIVTSRRKKEFDIDIEDYQKVLKEDVVRILNTLSKKNIILVFMKLENFAHNEEIIEEETEGGLLDIDTGKEEKARIKDIFKEAKNENWLEIIKKTSTSTQKRKRNSHTIRGTLNVGKKSSKRNQSLYRWG